MGLINFKDIDFNKSIDKELKIFEFNGSEIGVVPYLSINDKYDFVMITLQKAFEKGIYNLVKLDMYFNLHLVYMYTNIQIDNEDRVDEAALYDIMMRSGLIEKVIENIPEEEIDELSCYINEVKEEMSNYKGSLLNFLSDAISNLPQKAEEALNMLSTIDPKLLENFSKGPLFNLMNTLEVSLNEDNKTE